MSFELALGLWTVVSLLAFASGVFLAIVVAPDLRQGWRVLLRGRRG
jgi:hypothetical protein